MKLFDLFDVRFRSNQNIVDTIHVHYVWENIDVA